MSLTIEKLLQILPHTPAVLHNHNPDRYEIKINKISMDYQTMEIE